MKIAVALAVVIGSSAFAAPTDDLLAKKSAHYGGVSGYGGPVAYGGAPSYGAPSYGPSYGPPCGGAPIALYLAPQRPPHYREEEAPEEQSEHARSYAAPAASLSGYGASESYGAGAIGHFPHAKVGGCGVPLLLSCAPHVVAGHLAHAKHAAYSSVPSYKQHEEEETTELREAKKWTDAAKEPTDHADHHHHVILHDHEVPSEHNMNTPI